mgnify:CR=1 FL=1
MRWLSANPTRTHTRTATSRHVGEVVEEKAAVEGGLGRDAHRSAATSARDGRVVGANVDASTRRLDQAPLFDVNK